MQLSHELSVFLASSSGFWRANSEWTSSDGMAISGVQRGDALGVSSVQRV